jgi:hypothetical protein
MLENVKPGQQIRCTITATPTSKSGKDTLLRLMRQDPDIKKSLRRAQRVRRDTTRVYTRGGRDWYSRPPCGKIAKAEPGQSWTMTFIPHLAPDLKSVQACITVETAN